MRHDLRVERLGHHEEFVLFVGRFRKALESARFDHLQGALSSVVSLESAQPLQERPLQEPAYRFAKPDHGVADFDFDVSVQLAQVVQQGVQVEFARAAYDVFA